MSSQKPLWTQYRQDFLHNRLEEVHEEYLTNESFDTTELTVEVRSLEASVWRAGDYRQEIEIKRGDIVLVLLDLLDLDEKESDRDFLTFLSMIGECCLPIGKALKMERLEVEKNLSDKELVALTGLLSFLLMSFAELVVAEEALLNAQHPLFLETWKRAYMFYPEKLIEFNGVRYIRSDSPASNHH